MLVLRTNLKELREKEELTQQDLATEIGITRDTVKRLEGDYYKVAPYLPIYLISKYFQKPMDEIFWYEEVQ